MDPSPASIFVPTGVQAQRVAFFQATYPADPRGAGGPRAMCPSCDFLGFLHPGIPLAASAPEANRGEARNFGKAAAEGRDGSCCCPRRGKLQLQLGPCGKREHPCGKREHPCVRSHPKLPQAGAGRRRQAHGSRPLVSIGNQAGERCLSSRLGAEEPFVLFLSSRY